MICYLYHNWSFSYWWKEGYMHYEDCMLFPLILLNQTLKEMTNYLGPSIAKACSFYGEY